MGHGEKGPCKCHRTRQLARLEGKRAAESEGQLRGCTVGRFMFELC